MRSYTLTKSLLALGIIAAVTNVQAAEIRVNGFASVVGGKTISDSKVASSPFTAGVLDSTSVYRVAPVFSADDDSHYDDDISFKPETNLGLQLSADLGNNLSVVAQLTSQGANDFDAEIEWLYISYDINDQVNLKAGRQRAPLYAYSDYLDVGYAYHWIRPPQDVYSLQFGSYEGVSLTHTGTLGDWDTSVHGYYGSLDNDTSSLGQLDFNEIWGVVLSGSYDWLELRLAYHQTDVEAPDAFALTPNRPFADGNEEEFNYTSFGVKTNFGNFFTGFEYAISGFGEIPAANPLSETGSDESHDWYITAGYRIGDLTPHITFSNNTTEFDSDDVDGSGSAATDYRHGNEGSRDTWTLGLRYDFHPSAALKIEYTDSSDESSSAIRAAEGKPNEVSTLAVGVDIIF